MAKPNKSKILTLNSKLLFGKYKGETVQYVIDNNPKYLDWLIGEQAVELDNDAFNELRQSLKEQQ